MGAQVIYLEPIVNSSLWLNENVEIMLPSCANAAGHLLQLAAGMAAGVSKQGGHMGGGGGYNKKI